MSSTYNHAFGKVLQWRLVYTDRSNSVLIIERLLAAPTTSFAIDASRGDSDTLALWISDSSFKKLSGIESVWRERG